MKLTHLRLLVNNVADCFVFYRDVIGLQVTWGDGTGGYADFVASNGMGIALFDRREMAQSIGAEKLPNEALCMDRAMLIFEVADLQATVTELRTQKVSLLTDIVDHPDWGIRTVHLRDPEGNLIELNSPMAHEEWSDELKDQTEQLEKS